VDAFKQFFHHVFGRCEEWHLVLGNAFRHLAFHLGAGLGQPAVVVSPNRPTADRFPAFRTLPPPAPADPEAEQRHQDAERERRAAQLAEIHANDERDRAKRAEAKAEAINQFLVQKVLTFSPPGMFGYRYSDATVAQVLEQASRDVGTAFLGQPELEASVRLTIGNTFFRMGKYQEAGLSSAPSSRLGPVG
jgi:hypothetical protein